MKYFFAVILISLSGVSFGQTIIQGDNYQEKKSSTNMPIVLEEDERGAPVLKKVSEEPTVLEEGPMGQPVLKSPSVKEHKTDVDCNTSLNGAEMDCPDGKVKSFSDNINGSREIKDVDVGNGNYKKYLPNKKNVNRE